MNIYQRELINILKNSLVNPKEKYKINLDLDIDKLFDEAKEHCIQAVIYYFIKKEEVNMDKRWLIYNLVTQSQVNQEVDNIIDKLDGLGIKIILLKGLVISSYYPRREIRSMGDSDILVDKEDYPKIKSFLLSYGFNEEEGGNGVHKEFKLNDLIKFEVHWKLVNTSFINIDEEAYLRDIWNKSVAYRSNNIRCLDADNNVVYLIIHMAIHLKYSGFGLRQLYDLILIINKDGVNLNWNNICCKLKKYNIEYFGIFIFNVINKFFIEVIPKDIAQMYNISDEDIVQFLDVIFLSGVHGKRYEIKGYEDLMRYGTNMYAKRVPQKIFRVFFPHRTSLGEEYKYTIKYPITSIYGLIHYCIKKGVIHEYGLMGAIKNLKKALKIRRIRVGLLKTIRII